jgi:hypothetical protein
VDSTRLRPTPYPPQGAGNSLGGAGYYDASSLGRLDRQVGLMFYLANGSALIIGIEAMNHKATETTLPFFLRSMYSRGVGLTRFLMSQSVRSDECRVPLKISRSI